MSCDSAASAVCRVWKEEWAGAVMVSLLYAPGRETGAYRVSVSERRLITVSVENEAGGRLVMAMLPSPKKENKKGSPLLPAGLLPWRRFSTEEIAAAARRVGDHNPIHHGERPVAGGFLLLSEIVRCYPGRASYELRFHGKVFAEEDIFLREMETETGTKVEAYTEAGAAFDVKMSNE